jgi:sigma-B regulation protein RsbU (phosphoserine phosphatase)
LQNDQQTEFQAERILIYSLSPMELLDAARNPLGLFPALTDVKSRTLGEIFARLLPGGDFAICRLPSRGLTLLYFLPAPDSVIVGALSIQALENEINDTIQTLTLGVKERFAAMSLHEGGFAALLDDGRNLLAGQGNFNEADMTALARLLEEARANGQASAVLPLRRGQGQIAEMLAVVGHSRSFDWYTVLAAPLRKIFAPSRTLLARLILQSSALGLLLILIGLFLLRQVFGPLRLVVQKIAILSGADFSALDAGATLGRDLPLKREDEVGDLARAFASMGDQLHCNIRALMETASARDRMQGELNAARDIQRGILPLPELAPNIPGLMSCSLLEPARETGGDLYDFFTMPDGRHAFVIGDVSGKGVPAALFMAVTVTLTRSVLNSGADPGKAMSRINELLEAHNPGAMFVTLFLALYDPANGRLEYANGGHNPPCLLGGGLPARILEGSSGPFVGVMPNLNYRSFSHSMRQGELCLLYTDGVTEAINEKSEMYGEERLMHRLGEKGDISPAELLNNIFEDVKVFRGGAPPFDDIALLAFARR